MTQLVCTSKVYLTQLRSLLACVCFEVNAPAYRRIAFGLLLIIDLFCARFAAALPYRSHVNYHDVAIQVDRVVPVAPKALQVTVGSDTFVVAEADAGKQVIRHMLDGRVEFAPSMISSIALEAARNADSVIVSPMLEHALQSLECVSCDSSAFWQEIAARETGLDGIVWALGRRNDSFLQRRVCAGLQSLHEAHFNFTSRLTEGVIRREADTCLRLEFAPVLRELFHSGAVREALAKLRAIHGVFGVSASAESMSAQRVIHHVATLVSALDASRPDTFAQEVLAVQELAQGFGIEAGSLASAALGDRFVQRIIQGGRLGAVLEYLPSVNLQHRTPVLHEAVVKSIDGVSAQNAFQLISPRVVDALGVFIEKDEEIQAHVATLIARVVGGFLAEGEVDSACSFLSLWSKTPPGISPSLRKCTLSIIEALLYRGDHKRAVELASVDRDYYKGFLGVKLKLAQLGLSDRFSLGLIVILAVVTLTWLRRCIRSLSTTQRGETDASTRSPLGGESCRACSKPNSDDLIESLSFFGLKPGVTLQEIKSAYRSAVKRCHPDRSSDMGSNDNGEFIDLTKQYHRLLALYRRESGV